MVGVLEQLTERTRPDADVSIAARMPLAVREPGVAYNVSARVLPAGPMIAQAIAAAASGGDNVSFQSVDVGGRHGFRGRGSGSSVGIEAATLLLGD